MVQTNLFPAILIAGAPNCGKSVLSFLLTQRLRAEGISHYLLRTAPDGEGDWFQAGNLDLVRQIRMQHKRQYTQDLIRHMTTAIHHRALPLLVDIGGKPKGDQLEILRACTHSILLYRTQAERMEWQSLLAEMTLLPIAELCSDLDGEDAITSESTVFQASISGLDRNAQRRRSGKTFERLVRLVAGICSYEAAFLEAEHASRAPFPVLFERELASTIGVRSVGENKVWEPADLARLADLIQPGQPIALYGRGPVWLSTRLAVLALPAEFALFDVRYGWLNLSQIQSHSSDLVQFNLSPYSFGSWLEIRLSGDQIEPEEAPIPPINQDMGLVLSGKLPRWYFALLARHLAPGRPWLAIYVPALNQAVIVASHSAQFPIGMMLPGKSGERQAETI